jgi:hypothetical protein
VVISLVIASSVAFAKREHGAHVHGNAKLSIAFDQEKGKVEFQTPAVSIVGFEHVAKSAKDKMAVEQAKADFENNIRTIVEMPVALNCTFQKDRVEVKADADGDHSDFIASFNVTCLRTPKGETLTLDFSKYPGLKDVDATILVDEMQKTAEVKSKPVKVELKP